MAGRSADLVVLNGDERRFLESQVRRHKAPRSLSDGCRMILLCANGLESREVARQLGVHEHTVGKWRRFVRDRTEGLTDEYRPGRPRTVSDDQVAAVIERTLHSKPRDATHWSIRSMAGETGLSRTTIRRIWGAFGLQPHRSETFKLSTDPLFVDKVQDIVGLCLSPPNRAIVLCVDEKSQIQALDREQPVLPMMPGVAERQTHTYTKGAKFWVSIMNNLRNRGVEDHFIAVVNGLKGSPRRSTRPSPIPRFRPASCISCAIL